MSVTCLSTVCHWEAQVILLWNLVANGTREGDVHVTLLHMLNAQVSTGMPEVLGVALIVPEALVRAAQPSGSTFSADAQARAPMELAAMWAVMEAELALGSLSRDVSTRRGVGDDIESRNAPDAFRLALVQVTPSGASRPRYLSGLPFLEPGFAEVASTFKLSGLLAAARGPH